MELTDDQVAWNRFRRSGLERPFESPAHAARALMGVQSQFVPPSGLSLMHRVAEPFTEADLDRLLHIDRTLVRTWGQRRTVHVYATDDWPTVVSATQILPTYRDRLTQRLAVDDAAMDAAIERVGEILESRERGSRGDFLEADPSLAPWFEYGNGLVMDLARRGLVCHAQLESGRSYFAHRDRWFPGLIWDPPQTEQASLELARRYFEAYGPATVQDLAFWFGGKMVDARRWVATLGDELVEAMVGGEAMYLVAEDAREVAAAPPPRKEWPLRLLHRFDPLVLPHKDKSWLVDADRYKAVWRKAGYVEAIVLRHGRIAGVWRYDKKGKSIDVTVTAFGRLPARESKHLARLAEPVAAYFGRTLGSFEIA